MLIGERGLNGMQLISEACSCGAHSPHFPSLLRESFTTAHHIGQHAMETRTGRSGIMSQLFLHSGSFARKRLIDQCDSSMKVYISALNPSITPIHHTFPFIIKYPSSSILS